jgi:diguanylate cyclase (GGDEF)-like protein/PAS domain S-box-containing protein
MKGEARDILRQLDETLARIMNKGIGYERLTLSLACPEHSDPDLREICHRLNDLFAMLDEFYQYASQLAEGNLEASASRNNLFAMPLKSLQASLRHLTWQAGQVTAGDLQQQVHFLGDLSHSFNRMIQSLREKQSLEKRLQTITDVLGEGVYLLDPERRLIFMNPEAERLLGYRFDELAGKPIHEFIYGQFSDGTRFDLCTSPLILSLNEGREFKDPDTVFICKSGYLLPVALICRPILENRCHTGTVIAFHDITEQKKARESLEAVNRILEKQASTDPLTGILNRLKLSQLLDTELKRAKRYATPLSILLLDVDKFKSINDNYGHLTGDAVLKEMAYLISGQLRDSDVFARWGGEEFMILIPDCGISQARACAEKLCQAIAGHAFSLPVPVTASFGVAEMRPEDTHESLTNRADQALYAAKQNGRNRVECG